MGRAFNKSFKNSIAAGSTINKRFVPQLDWGSHPIISGGALREHTTERWRPPIKSGDKRIQRRLKALQIRQLFHREIEHSFLPAAEEIELSLG